MPSVTYQYVAFAAGAHQRQPTRTGSGGLTIIQTFPGGDPSSGSFVAPPPPGTQEVGSATYDFSFMTVSGGSLTEGGPPVGVTSFESNAASSLVFVGSLPINVLVVYVQVGGLPGIGSGATIDEFDQTTGQLINDTFVTVTPDPGGSLTTSGNVEGFVDTTNSAEQIVALPTTSPTGVDFAGWVTLGPPAEMSASSTLPVSKGQSVVALAFYNAPPANLGTMAGTVSEDSEGGIFLLGGAFVSALPGGSTKTNGDGTYVLTNLKPGPVAITVTHAVTTTARTTVTIVAGETVTENFVVTRLHTTS